jgi:carboxymethylenebutenolidase
MWNTNRTDTQQAIVAGITTYKAGNGDYIHAYVARPEGPGPFPGVVFIHHLPGWDELNQEFARRLANHGYTVITPDLYCRAGHGSPDDVAAAVRAEGGVSDDQVLADCEAARDWLKSLPTSNGKVGIMGTCSGGRHTTMVIGRTDGFDAAVDLWGGRVVADKDSLTEKQPVAPIDYTTNVNAPLLGLFGNDDQSPPPDQVDQHEAALKEAGKTYEFHRYDGAGHAFWYHDRPAFRPQQAMDAWGKVFAWYEKYLG